MNELGEAGPADPATAWFDALEARHLADLRPAEVSRALRALSWAYVERRGRLAHGAALDGAGKRAAFALFYAPLPLSSCKPSSAPSARPVMRGTKKDKFDEFYNILESAGARLGFSTGVHRSGFNGRSLAEDLPLLLNLLSDAMIQPSFPRTEVEKLRAQILTGLAISAEDTSDMASVTFDKILYKDHPYSRPEDGTPETIKRIARDDVVKFHRGHYGPRGMVIAIVGAVEADEVVRQVKRALGGWQVKGQKEALALPELKLLKKTVSKHHRIAGKSQSDIVVGTNGPRRKDPVFMSAMLWNSVLGQFGMMGRIGDSVREKAGLAYFLRYAFASVSVST